MDTATAISIALRTSTGTSRCQPQGYTFEFAVDMPIGPPLASSADIKVDYNTATNDTAKTSR
jgi:hypothetical protein